MGTHLFSFLAAAIPGPPVLFNEWFLWLAIAGGGLAGAATIWKVALRRPTLAVRQFVLGEFVPMVRAVLREFDRAGEDETEAAKSTRELVRDVRVVQTEHAERLDQMERWQHHHAERLDQHILASDSDSQLLKDLNQHVGNLSNAVTGLTEQGRGS